jgi:hypothetical protein
MFGIGKRKKAQDYGGNEVDGSKFYECWNSHTAGRGLVVGRGKVLRGDDARVLAHSEFFVEVGDHLPNPATVVHETKEDPPLTKILGPLKDEDAMVAVRSFRVYWPARTIRGGPGGDASMMFVNEGDRAHRNSALVKASPKGSWRTATKEPTGEER